MMSFAFHLFETVGGRIAGTAPFLLILVGLELGFSRERYTFADRLKGVAFWMVMLASASVCYALFGALWETLGLRPLLKLRFGHWFAWAGPLAMPTAVLTALLIGDLFSYWFHRIQHRFLWRFHAVHHSIEEMHAINSYGHPADEIFRVLLVVLPMSFIPVTGVVEPMLMTAIILLLPTYTHSPIRLHFGVLRYVLVDNVFHRIHHSTDPAHFHKNFGTYFTIWDQLFGTAYFPRKDEWPATGLADVREPQGVAEWLSLPFRYRLGALKAD